MTYKQLKALIAKHHGWTEPVGDGFVARFPTVYDREQFERERAARERPA